MTEVKLFEVTLKCFICAETQERAEDEMFRAFGVNYASMTLEEIRAGFVAVCPEPKVEPVIELQEPELGPDEIPF